MIQLQLMPPPYMDDEQKITSATYYQLFERIERIAMNVVRWDGLPENVSQLLLERYLFYRGLVAFFYDNILEQYLVLPVQVEEGWDVNYMPTVYNVIGFGGYRRQLSIEDSVLIFDNYNLNPGSANACLFASRLTNALRTMDVHLEANKLGKVIVAPEMQKKSITTLLKKIKNFQLFTIGSPAMGDAMKNIHSIDTQPNFVLDRIDYHYTFLWNDVLSYYGVYASSPKTGGVNVVESKSEASHANVNRCALINPRQDAAEKINKMFGLNVRVGSNIDWLSGNGGDGIGGGNDGRLHNDTQNSNGSSNGSDSAGNLP